MHGIGVYVHIPFCAARCDYCAFHSATRWNAADQRRVASRIIEDAAVLLGEVDGGQATLYVGGGTPSTLEPGLLGLIIDEITTLVGRRHVSTGSAIAEISVEANPASATPGFLAEAVSAGVSRLSVGVQTLHGELSRVIGRKPSLLGDLERIRATWNRSLGADLIVGIPGQSTRNVLSDLSRLIDMGFEHFSLYDLSVEPGTPLWRRIATETDSKGRVHHDAHTGHDGPEPDWTALCDYLAERGFQRYEVSNFARPGHQSQHNLGYWRSLPYIGLGPSATSTLRVRDEVVRLVRTSDHAAFLESDPWSGSTSELLLEDAQMREFVMLGLRTSEGVNRERFRDRFGTDLLHYLGPPLAELADAGYLVIEDSALRPTSRGMDFLDSVLIGLP